MEGREVVIVEAVRTPVGRGHPEKGYYRDVHPNELLGARWTEVIDRAGHPSRGGRGRHHRLRAAVRRAVVQHRPQRVAPGRPADRDAGDDDRPPVRLRAAGGQLRRRADRDRRPRRRDRRRRRAHGPHPAVRRTGRSSRTLGTPLPAGAARAPSARQPGPERGADRRAVGHLARASATRSRCARSSAPRARPTRAASSARSCPFARQRHGPPTDQGIRRETTLEALAELKPAFKEDGLITAGNSSQISDGARGRAARCRARRRTSSA